MPIKIDDKNVTKDVVLTRACVVNKKQTAAGTKVSLPLPDANLLLSAKKAVLPENYVAPKPKAQPEKK
jgi:hypothetical protein